MEQGNKGTPAGQTPERRNFHGAFGKRHQTIKKALKEFHKPLSEAIDYTIRIEAWNCDYSFGLNPTYDRLRPDNGFSLLYEAPYSEHRDLVLKGVILKPAKLRSKTFEARLARRADLDSKIVKENLQRYEDSPPRSVGAFLKQNSPILVYLSIPDDAFALALQNAAAHKINLMRLRGQQLRYGRGYIYGYELQEQRDE